MNDPTSLRQRLVDHILTYQGDHYRLAYSYVKDREAALDVVQDAVVKALAGVDGLRDPDRVRTWFCRILVNECMNYFRRGRDLVPYDDAMAARDAEAPNPAERLDLYAAIGRLNLQEQTVIRLRFFQDMKLEEIAQSTGTNLNTVKSRLYKALDKLRAMTREEIHDAS